MVALIDADFIPWVVCHNKTLEDGTVEDKSLLDCKNLADDFINNTFKDTRATSYLLFLTVGRCFRYDINSEYKSKRKGEKPKHFDGVKEHLIVKWGAIYQQGYEADDLVLIYSKKVDNSFIISPDKDLLNLVGQHYNPTKKEWIATSSNQANYYFAKSMIVGDSADNIPGLKGKGEVYANKSLGELYGTKDLLTKVFSEYLNHFNSETEAIEEFYKMYKSLKILDSADNVEIKAPKDIEGVYESKKEVVAEPKIDIKNWD